MNKQPDRWNQTKSPEVDPSVCENLVLLDSIWKNQSKNELLNKQHYGNEGDTWEKFKLDPYLTPYARRNSKWISDLNANLEATHILHINMGNSSTLV